MILRAGQPVAEMKPVVPSTKMSRSFGLCAGEFMVPEDFDAPLPEDILNAFEGK
jgi:antitoxin (DNA-binding transcriptional repressor) of toxin-antitoxin stability system